MELTKEDVTSFLLEAVSEPPTRDSNAEALRDLVEMIFTKMDEDGNGLITQQEFLEICQKDWICMEAFGQCLPDHRHRAAFLILLESEQDVMKDSLI